MSDIFISYKREEQPIARKLADALKGEGWTVWWDPKLRAGEHFDDVIEKALNEAKCVVVIWSEQSVQSRYIRAEATYALDRDKLVPVAIEKVNLPFRFRGVHTLNLLGWSGSKDFTDFRRLVDDLSTILGPSPVATAEEQRRLEADEHRKMEKERLGEQKKEEVKRKAEEERLPEQERQPSEVEARPKTERQNQNRRQFYAGGAVGIAVVAMTVWLSSGGKDGDVNKIVSLGIQGKRQLKVGEKSVLRAVGRFSDGRETDVTKNSAWQSSDDLVASVSADGQAEARKDGFADITVRYQGTTSTPLTLVVRGENRPTAANAAQIAAKVQQHLKAPGSYRDQGEYLTALAELAKAKSLDPANEAIQAELERTKKACLTERRIGLTTLRCE